MIIEMGTLGILLGVACAGPLAADVATYPGPKGLDPSDLYSVTVTQDGRTLDSFVYKVLATKTQKFRHNDTSWTTFSFSGRVTVAVTSLKEPVRSARILPSSAGLTPVVSGNTVTFELDRPRKVSVEIDEPPAHPMLVFADPLETDVPRPGAPGVVFFGPGMHEIGPRYRLQAGQTLYLAGGAYVKGGIVSENAGNITIGGRGILSGEGLTREQAPSLIQIGGWKGTEKCRVEGITLVQAPHYNLTFSGRDHVTRHVKMISWDFSTDGVGAGVRGLVEDCFFKVNDDAIKLYWSGQVARRNVIWQMENGACFQISWNMPSDNRGFHVHDCDVIRTHHRWKNDNTAVFNSIHGGKGHMSGYLFEDIRIENADWRLVNLLMKKTEFAPPEGWGRISDLTFRDIRVRGPQKMPSTIRGANPDHRVEKVRFEGLVIDGRPVRNAAEGNFEIDPATTRDVTFAAGE